MDDFAWDESKRKLNFEKHGIDFFDVIEIFEDENRIEAESEREGEVRQQTIGVVNGVVILVVYINRHEKRRIISARKASKREREVYYEI